MEAAKSSSPPLSFAPEFVVRSPTPPARTSSAMAHVSPSKICFPSGMLASLLVFALCNDSLCLPSTL
uniref:Uncharacterized protein n=1 Tax=Rhizophora mucronata TaxID=61149 RepID=A0A2P2P0P0_RHIMU